MSARVFSLWPRSISLEVGRRSLSSSCLAMISCLMRTTEFGCWKSIIILTWAHRIPLSRSSFLKWLTKCSKLSSIPSFLLASIHLFLTKGFSSCLGTPPLCLDFSPFAWFLMTTRRSPEKAALVFPGVSLWWLKKYLPQVTFWISRMVARWPIGKVGLASRVNQHIQLQLKPSDTSSTITALTTSSPSFNQFVFSFPPQLWLIHSFWSQISSKLNWSLKLASLKFWLKIKCLNRSRQ